MDGGDFEIVAHTTSQGGYFVLRHQLGRRTAANRADEHAPDRAPLEVPG